MRQQPPGEADWRRQHALSLASQLPNNLADALAVLDFTREIMVTFMQAGAVTPETRSSAPVVSLVRPMPDLSA